ncbi:receptor-like serine/threonine-protein kinase SD1-8 isoform X2 [Tasmannia lanceolata]|uniref:receptor-like serine/threonine-protein kinase SD1-8 isoform X2 n=1 Tax=Tasmannia lanceolata TaxID=3420 RepID=UPI004063D58A
MRNIIVMPSFVLVLTLFFSLSKISMASDIITLTQSIRDNQTLISAGETFELGFFSPGNSRNRYLGIWYKKIPAQTVVWIANRENPIADSSGVFKVGYQGNLVILDEGTQSVFWSANHTTTANNPVVQLLDTGNLVLREEGDDNTDNFFWQSFDYPSDTLLPGMKLGFNLKTGLDRFLTSWKSANDPSIGDYSFRINPNGSPQPFLMYQLTPRNRGGPWNGIRFSGIPEMDTDYFFKFNFVSNEDEIYYTYELINSSHVSILMVNQTGEIQRRTWVDGSAGRRFWNIIWTVPNDLCDIYAECGPYGFCNRDGSPNCNCVKGFEPKSPNDWYLRVGSGGCVRKTSLDCQKGDGFSRLDRMKLPDTSLSFVDKGMTLQECERECLKNCSCVAYANADIRGEGSGCIIWVNDLIDLRQYSEGGQAIYVRLAASELGDKKRKVAIIVSVTLASAMLLLLGWIGYCVWMRKKKKKNGKNAGKKRGNGGRSQEVPLFDVPLGAKEKSDESRKEDVELPFFDLVTVASATNNFSDTNKLGQGGFGPVYKGKLQNGQEIAVKRLSKNSGQGVDEFMNEVLLIAKLQHRNLVRLLGCCFEEEEKMLIYEYMQNGGLNSILFDETKRVLLDWQMRFSIVIGISRGLLYLHRDSRFRIIHRDLKASNILLDNKMNPKISDFGTARIFGGDQIEGNTKRVIGTYGYMSPEYAMDGLFSEKSDVYSFGVLVLEIVSGRKNRGFFYAEDDNLLGHTWRLWKEGNSLELMDPSMGASCVISEVLRCIQVGLLCVQARAEDRPKMSAVGLMLSSENPTLPQPKQPGIFAGRSSLPMVDSSSAMQDSCTTNEITVTVLEAR